MQCSPVKKCHTHWQQKSSMTVKGSFLTDNLRNGRNPTILHHVTRSIGKSWSKGGAGEWNTLSTIPALGKSWLPRLLQKSGPSSHEHGMKSATWCLQGHFMWYTKPHVWRWQHRRAGWVKLASLLSIQDAARPIHTALHQVHSAFTEGQDGCWVFMHFGKYVDKLNSSIS